MLEEDRTPGAFTDIFFKPWSNAYVFFAGFLFGFHLYDSKLVHSFFWTKVIMTMVIDEIFINNLY